MNGLAGELLETITNMPISSSRVITGISHHAFLAFRNPHSSRQNELLSPILPRGEFGCLIK